MSKKQKKVLYRLIIAAILLVVASLLPVTGIWKLLCFLVPYFVIGYDVAAGCPPWTSSTGRSLMRTSSWPSPL